jgi:hypothetical protein
MKTEKAYIEHKGKAVKIDGRFKHVMAITLNPRKNFLEGVVRCIWSRTGNPGIRGNVDRSVLCNVKGESLDSFEIGEEIKISGLKEITEKIGGKDWDFIGLEDPDIWIDEKTGLTHLYFTIPFLKKVTDFDDNKSGHIRVHLGHAVGKDFNSLVMTDPVLFDDGKGKWAKEVSIAPISKNGVRLNLFESVKKEPEFSYSTVRVAVARDMGKPWQYGKTIFHPKEHNIEWIAGDASPGPLLPKDFLDVGEGKMLGIINGREIRQKTDKDVRYGIFSVGLFIYDYENGKIDWVSPEPLIRDSEAKNITFASQFVPTKNGEGILYAHVDDSFVRAYTLFADKIKTLLP